MSKMFPKQDTRLKILFLYVALIFVANYLAFNQILPLSGSKGLWFYAGLASILLGNLLVTPHYIKPVDAISYAVTSGVAVYLVKDWNNWEVVDRLAFILSLAYCFLVLICGFITILTKDSSNIKAQKWSHTFRVLSDASGNQSTIFSVVILFSLIVFHRNSAKELFTISLVWIFVILIKPDEFLINLWEKINKIWKEKVSVDIIGDIVAHQTPGIVLFRQKPEIEINFPSFLLIKDSQTPLKVGIALNYTGRDEGLLIRAIEFDFPKHFNKDKTSILKLLPQNSVAQFELSNLMLKDGNPIPNLKNLDDLVGIVAPESSITTLYFEVIQEKDIEEGRLVEVSIRGKEVLYQIIDGFTKEEVVYMKNKYGYARTKAKKIGIWDDEKRKFLHAKWLPNLNSPIYLKSREEFRPSCEAIGHFPETNYTVNIKSIDHLVTHNTAILGILGIGKSMLAIELIERMIAAKIKVICLDLTNQYALELSDFYNLELEKTKTEKVREEGEKDKKNWTDNPEEGGSLPNLTKAIYEDLHHFLKEDKQHYLKIYNPSELFATKQLSDPKSFREGSEWKRSASLWSVTPVEITRIISETALQILSDEMTDKARACLVYEEAHSLVPEWGTVTTEGDKAATNGTARAILQGRKYGLGCLLITQRTANVTKTILNQCNTIFAMRTFDDTGKSFLSNYIGSDYADVLPSLEERYAVVFGKASSCENPVLIRLNNQDDFRNAFRKKYPPSELLEENLTPTAEISQDSTNIIESIDSDEDDEVPF